MESWQMSWSIKNLMFHDKPSAASDTRRSGYYSNPDCRHSAVVDVEHLPDHTTFNDLMPRMLCTVCDHRGADGTTASHGQGRSACCEPSRKGGSYARDRTRLAVSPREWHLSEIHRQRCGLIWLSSATGLQYS